MTLRQTQGFTLVEIAIVLVIIGLLLGGILRASELITSARVRALISQQEDIKAAYYGFEERFRAIPGDFSQATLNIRGATQNGNGNGRIENTTVPNESILAWEHLTQSGFLAPTFVYNATESALTTLSNSYGVFLQIIDDGVYGGGTTAAPSPLRHNIKTGSQIPVHILAEADRKIDDGMPNTGSFQFSRYQGNGAIAPSDGTAAAPACTSATTVAGTWNATNGSSNCGGASLL
ncbi:MAG TPA: prepilin-type N-terminal cleavage/methylation domain-containing protein [Burkholderiales bacterium]|nr:prepilin-type N-terminal cleavage/methylation domain-containing protein [Burkholderiales bacterium]